MEDFTGGLLEVEELKEVAPGITERAKVCFQEGGRAFEYKYKKAEKNLN